MKRLCLMLTLLLLIPSLACCTPGGSLPVSADPQTEDTTPATDTTEPATDPIPEDPPAEPVITTEEPHVTETDIPEDTTPAEPETIALEDVILVLPPLSGMSEAEARQIIDSARAGTSLPEGVLEIRVEHGAHSTPAGLIHDAEFVGEKAEDAYYVHALGGITLRVSDGATWENVLVPEGDKTIYLTFDDGPNPKYTEQILDVLKEYDVKATFFLVGEYMDKYPDIARRVKEEGHRIGCHSYTHNYGHIYATEENLMADLDKWEASARAILGEVPPERLFRFPGGSMTAGDNRNAYKQAMAYRGYKGYDWNALNNDSQSHLRPKDMTAEEYMKDSFLSTVAYSFRMKTSPHIVLVHETYQQTVDMLPWMIEYLREMGCTFATPDTLDASWYH